MRRLVIAIALLVGVCAFSCSDFDTGVTPDQYRGDLNGNGVGYEVADAELFGRYFLEGKGVFEDIQNATVASDINRDGKPLTLADYGYLLRVVDGTAAPYPVIYPRESQCLYSEGVLRIGSEVGMAHIVVKGVAPVRLLIENAELSIGLVGLNMHILVLANDPTAEFRGDFLEIDAEIESVEFATYEGGPVKTGSLLKGFDVFQNYPNPYNPTTNILFTLPRPMDYRIDIMNGQGTVVGGTAGYGNYHNVWTWDGTGRPGGTYYYRVTAGEFTKTMKMIQIR